MKWNMHSYTEFTGVDEDYSVVMANSSIGWTWTLYENDKKIDTCFAHSPTDSELACKAQVERIVNKLQTVTNDLRSTQTRR